MRDTHDIDELRQLDSNLDCQSLRDITNRTYEGVVAAHKIVVQSLGIGIA